MLRNRLRGLPRSRVSGGWERLSSYFWAFFKRFFNKYQLKSYNIGYAECCSWKIFNEKFLKGIQSFKVVILHNVSITLGQQNKNVIYPPVIKLDISIWKNRTERMKFCIKVYVCEVFFSTNRNAINIHIFKSHFSSERCCLKSEILI